VSPRTVRRWVAGETQPDGLYLRALSQYVN